MDAWQADLPGGTQVTPWAGPMPVIGSKSNTRRVGKNSLGLLRLDSIELWKPAGSCFILDCYPMIPIDSVLRFIVTGRLLESVG